MCDVMTGHVVTVSLCSPEGVVDQRVLHEGGEHEADTDALPHVDSLGVGHGREGVLYAGLGGGHCQQGCHAQRHPGGNLTQEY